MCEMVQITDYYYIYNTIYTYKYVIQYTTKLRVNKKEQEEVKEKNK